MLLQLVLIQFCRFISLFRDSVHAKIFSRWNGWALRSQKNRQPFERLRHPFTKNLHPFNSRSRYLAYTFTNRLAYPFKTAHPLRLSVCPVSKVRINSYIRSLLYRLKSPNTKDINSPNNHSAVGNKRKGYQFPNQSTDGLIAQSLCELRSLNIWSLVYSFASFTFYGYITNSQSDQLPDGLIVQSVEHCTGIADGHGFESRSGLKFFQVLHTELLKLCV